MQARDACRGSHDRETHVTLLASNKDMSRFFVSQLHCHNHKRLVPVLLPISHDRHADAVAPSLKRWCSRRRIIKKCCISDTSLLTPPTIDSSIVVSRSSWQIVKMSGSGSGVHELGDSSCRNSVASAADAIDVSNSSESEDDKHSSAP